MWILLSWKSISMSVNFVSALPVPLHTLEHLPDIGTTDEFSFEINSIVKDYFDGTFLPLTGVNATQIKNCLVGFRFSEVVNNTTQNTAIFDCIVYNMTQDVFEIEDFNLSDYDCGSTGSTSSKLLTSCPSPLPIGDKTSVHVSCLKSSYSGDYGTASRVAYSRAFERCTSKHY